ncbi:MAG: glycosyltransferase family 39 protein [Acidobacteria bacterium]|nr:glycosyltransferase family 39 protein [Acidobacteriota bacterium]
MVNQHSALPPPNQSQALPPAPTAWTLLLAIAALPLAAHLLTAGNYGIFRDEYYYLACARHLAWGYVDHPPLSMAVLALIRAVAGEGILALRIFPALCASALVLLTGCLAARLGGDRFAQVLAAVAMSITGVMQAITGFYSMNALDLVIWGSAWLLLARWVAETSPRLMIWLGILLGLGLMNKIGVLILGAALALALLLTPLRRTLRTPAPYLGGAVALLIFLPHLVWQMTHGWPTLRFMANARQYKITAMSPPDFLAEVVLEQHPFNLLIWAAGLGWLLFAARARRFRLLGLMFVIGLGLLMLQHAKPYYTAGLFPVLFAAGACWWERFCAHGRRRWLRPAILVLLIAGGLFTLPMGVPVLPVETFARWQVWTGIAPASQEVGYTSELPQIYADRFGWEELAAEVARVIKTLPPAEQAQVVIIAQNYGQAGALEYWGERYGLPHVVSGHNNYWFWAPAELSLETVIVVGWSERQVLQSFTQVEHTGALVQAWARENGVHVWVAREPKLSWPQLRGNLRNFI